MEVLETRNPDTRFREDGADGCVLPRLGLWLSVVAVMVSESRSRANEREIGIYSACILLEGLHMCITGSSHGNHLQASGLTISHNISQYLTISHNPIHRLTVSSSIFQYLSVTGCHWFIPCPAQWPHLDHPWGLSAGRRPDRGGNREIK